MSNIFKDRHAKLGCIVLILFPKVMQTILKYYVTPQWLKKKYLKKNLLFIFTENEIVLMDKLPNMDELTIDICYKILKSEDMLDEPKCKWGNVPHDTELEIADDIQRLINATNSIINISSEEVTKEYYEILQEEIKLMTTRIDSFLEQDTLGSLYNSLCRSETDSISILQDLTRVTRVNAINDSLLNTASENGEWYSRISMAIIETFPNILRDVIQSCISAKQLYQKCVPVLKHFVPEQQTNLIKLQHTNTYDSLDITLIYKLLRQFLLIPPPTKGWGSIPNTVDIILGDDIERIRGYRNQLVHRCDTNIDRNLFDDYFDNFRDIGQRMDLYFYQTSDYERRILRHKTCMMDSEMQAKYENALKEIENIKMRFEKMPIKFYWGESFNRCLKNLRSMLKDEKAEGREKVRVQIIFQNEEDVETTVNILNSLKDEINEGLTGIEFIVATKGSVVLDIDIQLEMLETDEKLQTTMGLFIEKIVDLFTTSPTESIAMVLLSVEEFTQWNNSKHIEEKVCLDFDIEAQLFETDDQMEDQLGKISDAVIKHSTGSETNSNITATLLPISLENIPTTVKRFTQAQTTVKYNFPDSFTFRQQLNVKESRNDDQNIWDCVKMGNTLAFTESLRNQLIICNTGSTDIHHIPLHYKPWYLTEVDSTSVAVSCMIDKTILIINISTGNVINKIETSDYCYGISYNEDRLYVVIGKSVIHVMDLKGILFRTINLPADSTVNITVDRDRLVCIDSRSIYCWSIDGQLIWTFENGKYESLRGVTTDDKGHVYVTDYYTNTVVKVSDDGKNHREILTKSNSLNHPCGIHFEKKHNVLLVCNINDIKAFLFDVKRNINEED